MDLKYLWSLVKALIYWGRWLKTFIPHIKAPLLNFDKSAIGRCKLLLFLVLYLWISLFVSNRCLLLIVYKTNEHMYWASDRHHKVLRNVHNINLKFLEVKLDRLCSTVTLQSFFWQKLRLQYEPRHTLEYFTMTHCIWQRVSPSKLPEWLVTWGPN